MRIVKNGDVHVSAPIGMPKKEVERFIEEELRHLLEPSHNARFHALMDKFFPRWKEARKETRQICKMEEDENDD